MPDRQVRGAIYLTADSLLLLRADGGRSALVESVHGELPSPARAAYIGASNGDEPAFYSIFEMAMDALGIGDRRMISSGYAPEERAFVDAADLVLLAGGDVARGWRVMTSTGMRESIVARHAAGAVLLGVSAGAVQLGLGLGDLATFGLVPRLIDVHREKESWVDLRRAVGRAPGEFGLGIPHGGAVVYRPDGTIDVFGQPALELALEHGEFVEIRRDPA